MVQDEKPLPRSPRAALVERQARVTRAVLGVMIVAAAGAAGWGVTWLRDEKARRARDPGAAPESRAADTRPGPAAPATSRAAGAPEFHADLTIPLIRERCPGDSVESAWELAQTLRTEAALWEAQRAPQAEINKLLAAALDAEKWILGRRPSFPELRRLRGEVRWPAVLGDYEDFATRFLTKADAARLSRLLREFERIAEENHGWIVLSEYESAAGPLVRKAVEGHRAFDKLLESPLGRAAREVEIRDLAALRDDLPTARFRPFYHLPYVLLTEQSDHWEEEEPAARVARVLLGLRKSFFDAYGEKTGLVPQNQRAVPVVLFASRTAYHKYRAARKFADVAGTEAHFEPSAERLVLHAECSPSTLLHEGTHQLIRANIRAPLATYAQSFWFHEGFAEWFAGCRELGDGPDGLPRFEPGALMAQDLEPGRFLGPLAVLRGTPRGNRFPLKTLVGLMLKDRDQFETEGAAGAAKVHLVYAQGWFLIYFLNHFNVDADGVVRVGLPGAHREVWLRYLKRELEGASGEATFLEVLRESNLDLDAVERDLNAYLDFVIAKVAKGHVRDRQIVAWDAVPATDSRPAATEADDRLKGG